MPNQSPHWSNVSAYARVQSRSIVCQIPCNTYRSRNQVIAQCVAFSCYKRPRKTNPVMLKTIQQVQVYTRQQSSALLFRSANPLSAQTQKLRTAYKSRSLSQVPTKHIVLFFRLRGLPSAIKTIIPTAMYVLTFQIHWDVLSAFWTWITRLPWSGHLSKVCWRGPEGESGKNEAKCANCKGDQPIYLRSCLWWKDEKHPESKNEKYNLLQSESAGRAHNTCP